MIFKLGRSGGDQEMGENHDWNFFINHDFNNIQRWQHIIGAIEFVFSGQN